MSNLEDRQLQEQISHAKIEAKYQNEWEKIPDELKPTSKGRWDQMMNEQQTQASRRLGFPSTRRY